MEWTKDYTNSFSELFYPIDLKKITLEQDDQELEAKSELSMD